MMSSEEKAVIAKARSLNHFPVGRNELVHTLALDPESGQRFGGGIRNGYMILEESWKCAPGLTVRAFDTEYIGPIPLTGEMVDGIIDGTGTFPGTNVRINSPRKTFNGFMIVRGNSELYNSREEVSGGNGG